MKFFLPHAENDEQAERGFASIAQFIGVPVPTKRIYKLSYKHNGFTFEVEVGKVAPEYYEEGQQKVIAIFNDGYYRICLPLRGVIRGIPILAGHHVTDHIEFFD
jgi:hypothetical protein